MKLLYFLVVASLFNKLDNYCVWLAYLVLIMLFYMTFVFYVNYHIFYFFFFFSIIFVSLFDRFFFITSKSFRWILLGFILFMGFYWLVDFFTFTGAVMSCIFI